MIKANELRIGNLVFLKSLNKNYTIECGFDIEKIEDGEDALPIPLTEEWLIKFGFKQYHDFKIIYDLMPLCGFGYDISTKQVVILEKGNPNSHWIERKIEYIHELQNLYFALRGQELTITH